jgi:hypothetical protein
VRDGKLGERLVWREQFVILSLQRQFQRPRCRAVAGRRRVAVIEPGIMQGRNANCIREKNFQRKSLEIRFMPHGIFSA